MYTDGVLCSISRSSSDRNRGWQVARVALPAPLPDCMRRFTSSAYLALICGIATAAVAAAGSPTERFAGVDLSYVNEVEACGAEFRLGGKTRDPYELFAEKGANLVRLRRSLEKITYGLPADRFSEADWHALLNGYRQPAAGREPTAG